MSPPSEQLIRDYLNRLSVAARGRLDAEERRALVTRTRDFIDRNASASGPATSMEVAALLARLGDPAVLIDQEVARLAAARGEAASRPGARGGRLGEALRRRNSHASWHWPQATGSRALQDRLLNGTSPAPGTGPAGAGRQPMPAGTASGEVRAPRSDPAGSGSEPVPAGLRNGDGPHVQGDDASSGPTAVPPIRIPAQRPHRTRAQPGPSSSAGTATGPDPAAARPARPAWPSMVWRSATTPAGPANSDGPADGASGTGEPVLAGVSGSRGAVLTGRSASIGQQVAGASQRLLPGVASLAGRILAWARPRPVAAIAITLLGIGGASYPPLWLVGAGFALASRRWDYRDKWIGLAGPVLLLVVVTALGVALTTHHAALGHYVHVGWVYADVLSRICALASAGYLLWRIGHARRTPAVPPWNKPRKVA
ncbi:MAG TPA: hypothetical protein VEL03_01345 [Streptosporangiaceae bacterium]|nr:hypothetical protein [Streptosporangiaceae bacterium]